MTSTLWAIFRPIGSIPTASKEDVPGEMKKSDGRLETHSTGNVDERTDKVVRRAAIGEMYKNGTQNRDEYSKHRTWIGGHMDNNFIRE